MIITPHLKVGGQNSAYSHHLRFINKISIFSVFPEKMEIFFFCSLIPPPGKPGRSA
jgi:hypothetical protein